MFKRGIRHAPMHARNLLTRMKGLMEYVQANFDALKSSIISSEDLKGSSMTREANSYTKSQPTSFPHATHVCVICNNFMCDSAYAVASMQYLCK